MTELSIEEMRIAANSAVNFLKVLANEDRLLLMCKIALSECNVSELCKDLCIEQPTLSQQLGVLRRSGLVVTRKEGKQIYYKLEMKQLMQ